MRKALYPDNWPELRAACLERAGKQCEYVDPTTGKRCPIRDEEIRRSKHSGRKYVVALYACHLNDDPDNPEPELICLYPAHHMKLDRNKELRERLSCRRRGYQLTTTDSLLREINTSGITVTEHSDGYHWTIDGTELAGQRTTAVAALGSAIHQLCCLLALTRRELQQTQPFCVLPGPLLESRQEGRR